MSRLAQARPAIRPALKARALLSGPSGSGKTRSALIMAEVLAGGGPILVIDTERESALTYADDFTFDHLMWEPPFEPRALADTLMDAGRSYAVVIVDSMTHFWRGSGGVLDIAGGKFTGWKDARPAHTDLVEALLRCDAHFIGCARSKVEHVQEVENGRHVVRKLGMAVVQDDDLEYELNVAVEMDMDHSMTVAKSRTTAVPVGRTFTAGKAAEFAAIYKEWLAGGEPPADARLVEDLRARMAALPDGIRVDCKSTYFAELGRPEHLTAARADDAEAIVARYEQAAQVAQGQPAEQEPTGPPDSGATGDVGAGEEPDAAPPATPRPGDDNLVDRDTVILLSKWADRAWPLADFGRGKTAERRRYRRALTNTITGGRTASVDALTVDEGRKLEHDLSAIVEGLWSWEATDAGLVICHEGDDGRVRIVCPWVVESAEAVAS